MPFARLFRSRWSALFWAGGILWTAYDVATLAPPARHDPAAPGNSTDLPDMAQLARLAGAAN